MNAVVVIAGFVVGFLVGMTGMGGGALMTPFLILFMRMNPVLAVGTDLVFAAFTKIASSIQHSRQGTVRLRPVFWMAVGSLPASWLSASFLLSRVDDEFVVQEALPKSLGVILLVVSVIVLARLMNWIGRRDEAAETHLPHWAILIAVGVVGGLLVGFTSGGGGTVIIALLLIFFAIPTPQLVGLDVVHGAVLALFAAIAYGLAGQVDWPLVGWLLLGSIPGTLLGTRAVTILPQKAVRGMIGGLLFLTGLRLLF